MVSSQTYIKYTNRLIRLSEILESVRLWCSKTKCGFPEDVSSAPTKVQRGCFVVMETVDILIIVVDYIILYNYMDVGYIIVDILLMVIGYII